MNVSHKFNECVKRHRVFVSFRTRIRVQRKNMKPLTDKVFFLLLSIYINNQKTFPITPLHFPWILPLFLYIFSYFFLLVLSDDIKIQGGFKKEQKTQKSYYAKSLEQQTYKVLVTIWLSPYQKYWHFYRKKDMFWD